MISYVTKKVLLAIPLVFGVVTLTFILLELAPGDISAKFFTPDTPPEVREMIAKKYGLDLPAYVRYFYLIGNLARFDFGVSMASERPVFDIILERLPNTLLLSGVSLVVSFVLGIGLGIIQGVKHRSWIDTSISAGSLFLYAMPAFWLALMCQLLFAYHWSEALKDLATAGTITRQTAELWSIPISQMTDISYEYMTPFEQWVDRLKHILLPGVAMGVASAAGIARYMRSSLLEVIRQDYIRTARAKGLPERVVILKHALRNALLPIVTLVGLSMPVLFSGAVLIEDIFAWPGMGREIIAAIRSQDTPMIIACFYVFTLLVVAGNIAADVAYAFVDPRIRYD